MINRRTAIGIIASASTIGASGVTLAKEKKHLNGNALLGEKIKQNGKHKIHTIGKTDVFAEVNNGKVVGVSAAGMQVKKVKSSQKLAETTPGLILASMQVAQTDVSLVVRKCLPKGDVSLRISLAPTSLRTHHHPCVRNHIVDKHS